MSGSGSEPGPHSARRVAGGAVNARGSAAARRRARSSWPKRRMTGDARSGSSAPVWAEAGVAARSAASTATAAIRVRIGADGTASHPEKAPDVLGVLVERRGVGGGDLLERAQRDLATLEAPRGHRAAAHHRERAEDALERDLVAVRADDVLARDPAEQDRLVAAEQPRGRERKG